MLMPHTTSCRHMMAISQFHPMHHFTCGFKNLPCSMQCDNVNNIVVQKIYPEETPCVVTDHGSIFMYFYCGMYVHQDEYSRLQTGNQ